MKKLFLTASAMLAYSSLVSAAPCTVGTLASYIALGPGGCTIGGDTFSGFQALTGAAGVTPIATSAVSLNPLGGATNPGFTASVGSLTATAGKQLESIFTYKISGASYSASFLTLTGSSETADGGVTAIENYCLGGNFGASGVSGCTGTAGSLLTLDGIQNNDSSTFAKQTLISVTNDLELDGGLSGTAKGGSFTNQFTAAAAAAVPEPAAWLLTGLGISLAGFRRVGEKRQRD